jgi:leader peptidase (prepilin peptidase)/N-methyltransferase
MTTIPDPMAFFFLIILGASFGSFLNVVIYRVPEKMSLIKPASHCYSCKTPIKPFDNIPILSYFILGGKCRQCGNSFSSRYAIVEGLTAGFTVWLFIIFGINEKFFMYLILTYLLIAITFVDIDHFIIPNGFVLFGLAVLIVGLPMDWLPIDWEDGVSGAFVFAGFLFAIGLIGQFILKKESIGFGDIKLGLVLGGYLGVEYSVLALYLSFAISAIFVFIMLGSKMISKSQKIPFGPYLAGGTLLSILTTTPTGGNYILDWYISTMF